MGKKNFVFCKLKTASLVVGYLHIFVIALVALSILPFFKEAGNLVAITCENDRSCTTGENEKYQKSDAVIATNWIFFSRLQSNEFENILHRIWDSYPCFTLGCSAQSQ